MDAWLMAREHYFDRLDDFYRESLTHYGESKPEALLSHEFTDQEKEFKKKQNKRREQDLKKENEKAEKKEEVKKAKKEEVIKDEDDDDDDAEKVDL
jgi:hypothetical protein